MINNNHTALDLQIRLAAIYQDAISEVQRVLKLEPHGNSPTRSEELARQVRCGDEIIEIRSESERLFVGLYHQAWINSQCGGFAPIAPRLLGTVRSEDDTPGMRFNAARGGSKE